MAGPAPKTKNWTARETLYPPHGLQLAVAGQVEVTATYKVPKLTEAPHVGRVLPLDLTIETTDQTGAEVVVWAPAHFYRMVSKGEFDRVVIRWDGKEIAACPVLDDAEHAALIEKQAKAQNTVAKVKTAAPAKKAAAKKAVKKSAKKAVKKVAKKTAKKKTAKKVAKKVAKKTAKTAAKKKKAVVRARGKVAKARTMARKAARQAKTFLRSLTGGARRKKKASRTKKKR